MRVLLLVGLEMYEYMLKILEINPSDVVVHYNLGFLFKEKNNLTRQRNTI
jgi:hypothetical protein